MLDYIKGGRASKRIFLPVLKSLLVMVGYAEFAGIGKVLPA